MVTDTCQVARSWIEIPLQGRLKSNSRLIVGALSLLIFSDASSCPDTVHFFGIGEFECWFLYALTKYFSYCELSTPTPATLLRHPLFLERSRSPCSGQREWSGFSQILTLIFTSGQGHLTNLLLISFWHMQLPEPLTGKTWKLDDFEAYPALLVPSCIHFTIWIHGCRWIFYMPAMDV